MRYLILFLAMSVPLPDYAAKQVNQLVAPPPGATLPVIVIHTVDSRNLTVGQPILARFSQPVPVGADRELPAKVEILGNIVSIEASSIGILFTELRWRGQTVPVNVRLVAAASSYDVFHSSLPLGGTDRGTADPADWTTRQIGGDEVYRSAGYGGVYNRFSEPVGHADLNGVYENPAAKDGLPRAMGPFSTTAIGLHGLPGFSIVSPGASGKPIVMAASHPEWKLVSGDALLLEVID
jgi:hypothetical protein